MQATLYLAIHLQRKLPSLGTCCMTMETTAFIDQSSGITFALPGHQGGSQKLCWYDIYELKLRKIELETLFISSMFYYITEWPISQHKLQR